MFQLSYTFAVQTDLECGATFYQRDFRYEIEPVILGIIIVILGIRRLKYALVIATNTTLSHRTALSI